jgi:molybdenum cofactor cytidylyltransferase
LEVGLDPVCVITGAYADQVEQAVADLPVECVFNPAWETGQGASVAAAVQALPPRTGAAVFLLADQPLVTVSLISSLMEAHSADFTPIIGPMIDGQRGNPVLFDRVTFKHLSQLQGEMGGRAIFSRYPVRWIPWHDASARLDIDTPADFGRLLD